MNLYKIMLVDDEEEVRKSIINKIDWADAGFEVIGDAENGKDALEKIEQNEPDVVLTDIKMPYMDGLTMAETIRQLYPCLLYTSVHHDAEKQSQYQGNYNTGQSL